jgi:hypothetical protein
VASRTPGRLQRRPALLIVTGFYGQHVANEDSNHFHYIALTRTVQFSATTTVKVSCSTSDDGVVANDASLIATQVGAIN